MKLTGVFELKKINAGASGGIEKASEAQKAQKEYLPIFVPMGYQKGLEKMVCRGEEKPVHVADVLTRAEALDTFFEENSGDWPGGWDLRTGSAGGTYKAYFMSIVCGAAALLSMGCSVYVAAVFAYLAGHYWSNRLCNSAWSLTWYKGKSLVYTK